MDTSLFKIPNSDIEAWNRYPKYNWMYSTQALLNAQNIHWSPNNKDGYIALPVQCYDSSITWLKLNAILPLGYIFAKEPNGNHLFTEVAIHRGEIKCMCHHNKDELLDELVGEVELRVSAFVRLYFAKFNGIVCFETYGSDIYSVHLKPTNELLANYNSELKTQVRKLYRRKDKTEH